MPFEGNQLTYKNALALCYAVGFRGKHLTRAVAVMTAESDRYEEAYHDNADGSRDRGLFQINTVHKNLSDADAYLAKPNTTYAYGLSRQGQDWTLWSAFNSGAYRKFVPIVRAVKALGLWKSRVPSWQ